MNFVGKVYWTTTGQDQVCCYDTATGQFSHAITYDPTFPHRSDSRTFQLGSNVMLGDGRILTRLRTNVDDAMAAVFDAALPSPAATIWTQVGSFPDRLGAVGTYDAATGLNWLLWREATGSGGYPYAHMLTGFDNAGNVISRACDANLYSDPANLSTSEGWGNNMLNIDGWLYWTSDASNTLQRYNVSTDEWQVAGTWYRSLCGYDSNIGLVFFNARDATFDMYAINDLIWNAPGDTSGAGSWNIPPRQVWPIPAEIAKHEQSSSYSGLNRTVAGRIYLSTRATMWTDCGYDSAGNAYGDGVTLWSISLVDGTYEKEFTVPYQIYNNDGTIANGNNGFYVDTSENMFGMLLVPNSSLSLNGEQTDARRVFVGS